MQRQSLVYSGHTQKGVIVWFEDYGPHLGFRSGQEETGCLPLQEMQMCWYLHAGLVQLPRLKSPHMGASPALRLDCSGGLRLSRKGDLGQFSG